MAHFGKTLVGLISERNLTLKRFAERAGVSLSLVSRAVKWEKFKGHKYQEFADGLKLTTEQLDAAWKGDAADLATPAKEPDEEKPMNFTDIRDIAKLSYEECDVLQGALDRRIAQLHPDPNPRAKTSARTASKAG
jgi:transcriptional regulator with XRE-family HTH domain